MKTRTIVGLMSVVIFSSLFVSNAYGSIYLDKEVYTWTDKIHIRITEHGLDSDKSSVRIYTSGHELDDYKLSKAGNGLYTGEVILTGFLHDVDGDGKPDTNPRTMGNGPNNGFLESKRDGGFTISIEFGDGDVMSKSAKISWNKGNIVFDMSNYLLNESAKIQVTDPDLNLNPETLDTIKVHVFSDSDKAGILVKAIETQEESGLFETTVSFTQDRASSGNRLFAVSGDMIYAQYNDHTLPVPYGINDDLEIIAESILRIDSIQKPVLDDVSMNMVDAKLDSVIVESPDYDIQTVFKVTSAEDCHGGYKDGSKGHFEWFDGECLLVDFDPERFHKVPYKEIFAAPLKQIKAGVALIDIQCNEGKHVVYKRDRMRAACLTDETEWGLLSRGWAALRLGMPATDDLGRDLCDLFEGEWDSLPRNCYGLKYPLLCSMSGGDVIDMACFIPSRNGVAPVN